MRNEYAIDVLMTAFKKQKLDSVLLGSIAALAGAIAWSEPLLVAIGFVIVFLVWYFCGRFSFSKWAIGIAIGLAAISFFRVHQRAKHFEMNYEHVRAQLPHPTNCAFQATIATMPVLRGTMRADVETQWLDCEGQKIYSQHPIRIRLYDMTEESVREDEYEFVAQLGLARRSFNPDLTDGLLLSARRQFVFSGTVLVAYKIKNGTNVLSWIDRMRGALRRGLQRSIQGENAAIARALVLGEEDLVAADDDAFRRSGLTHLLAVSGSHVALVVGSLVAFLRFVLLRCTWVSRRFEVGQIAAAIGIVLAILYEQLAGDSGSARRATTMAVIVLMTQAMGARANLSRTLGFSIVAALILDPMAPFDLSFTLSLAATLGLILISPSIQEKLTRYIPKFLAFVVATLAATLAATIACSPFIIKISGSIPLLSVIANILAVPVGEMAALPFANGAAWFGVCAEITHGSLIEPLFSIISHVFGSITTGSILVLRAIAQKASAPSWSSLQVPPPTEIQITIFLCAIGCLCLVNKKSRQRIAILLIASACWLLAEYSQIRSGSPHGILRVTVLDIGQGDSTLIDFPDGTSMLIDAGGEVGSSFDPGKIIVTPTLLARRKKQIEIVALSHPHPDHFLGLSSVFSTLHVKQFWDTGQGETESGNSNFHHLLRDVRHQNIAVLRPHHLCDRPRIIGGALVEVLAPCPMFNSDHGANDNSLVIRICLQKYCALFVGDSEHIAEEQLLSSYATTGKLRSHFLKVGHHGSRTSSTEEFLKAVAPSVASISCGVRNRFGHPHKKTLDTFSALGIKALRTDLEGSIQWQTDGTHAFITTSRSRILK